MGQIIIDVLGLGPSLDLYKKNGNISIGVNDIWSRVQTDYIVCVDLPDKFTPERLKVIQESNPIKFYSHLDEYKERPDFEKIELLPYYPNQVCQLNTKQLPKSLCSPFVACVIAFKFLGATEIHLYGVDLINHPHLDKKQCEKIKVHFRNLKIALRQKHCEFVIFGDGILRNL
jgi:hypothetical protein